MTGFRWRENRKILAKLFWWRIRYFATETFRLILRRWQTTVFLLLLFAPALTPPILLLHYLGLPVLIIVETTDLINSAAWWLCIVLIAISWSTLQATALSGGSGWHYISRLLSPRQIMVVNLRVLAVVDLPLLLPFFGAEIALFGRRDLSAIPDMAAVGLLALQLPIIQLLAQRALIGVLSCLLLDLLGLWANTYWASSSLLVVTAALSILTGLVLVTRYHRKKASISRHTCSTLQLSAQRSKTLNILSINLRYLCGSLSVWRYFGWLIYMSLPILVVEVLRKQGIAPVNLALIAVFCLLPLTYSIAGLLFDLQGLHADMQVFYTLYHISDNWLATLSFMLLLSLFFGLCLLVTLAFYLQTLSWITLLILPIALLMASVFMLINFRKIHKNSLSVKKAG
jgi:hypothetical protein